jgi:redox-sensitive bicupin YhaK (pirin superfamily)
MSYQNAAEPVCTGSEGAVEPVIESRAKDLGGFTVRRVLPSRERRMVGRSLWLEALSDSHVMVIGGSAVGHRHIWWNFVSSSKEAIEQAKRDWREGRFETVPGESEFIPLPD